MAMGADDNSVPRSMRFAVWSVLGVAVAIGACEAVPDVRFADDEAGVDGGGSDATSSSDAAADAGPDAATALCPPTPSDAVACCGTTPCVGKNCPSQCNKCSAKACGPGLYCCLATGAAVCIAPGAACN